MMKPGVIVRFIPELTHRHVGASGVSESVKRAVAIGLNAEITAMLMREFREVAGIIIGDEIGDGPPHIPKKSFGLFRAGHEPAGENWQVREQIVASPFLKLLAKARCPVLE